LTDFFQFWCYVTPVLGAVISDQYLGKYWTIFYSALIYMVGSLILFLTSLPVAIENGAALGGLIAAMIVIGLGTGGIKSNVSPLIAEQYENTTPFVKTLKSGERVIVDPATTIGRICKPVKAPFDRIFFQILTHTPLPLQT
jgi:POT family proton-dependent oligopeptide transporter